MENANLNELVRDLYNQIGSKKKYSIYSLKLNTIFFMDDNRALEVNITLKPLSTENVDEILEHAEMIKKWRDKE